MKTSLSLLAGFVIVIALTCCQAMAQCPGGECLVPMRSAGKIHRVQVAPARPACAGGHCYPRGMQRGWYRWRR